MEWTFLEKCLNGYGFDPQWVARIMFCVSTPHMAVLVNGSPTLYFQPSRGLQQGDSLSSYLFFLCVKVLSSHLAIALHQAQLQGIKVAHGGESISHMAFTDDLILFGEATSSELHSFTLLLEDYCRFSGFLDAVFRVSHLTPGGILNKAFVLTNQFSFAIAPTSRRISQVQWDFPPPPMVKVNVDGASSCNPGLTGIGGVFCDHSGQFHCGFSAGVGLAHLVGCRGFGDLVYLAGGSSSRSSFSYR
ncbi:uncharacterized protein LOC122066151 [Macadamia integrifolia]|uniref:uncharacterized protein LOC122066151 n=1 Tax=Macadamia integrifolia TaxID=60698 RepID=UPI001C4F2C9E|nr:uncharacterized protein LOC122066151 [Macadamia integrifolia]